MILRLSIPNPPTPPKALKSLWLPQSHAPPSLLSGSVFWGEKHPLHNPSYPSPAQPRHKVKEVLATSQASLSISQCLGVTLGAKFAHPTHDSRKSEHLQRYEVSKKFLNEIIWSCPADTRNPPFNTGKQRGEAKASQSWGGRRDQQRSYPEQERTVSIFGSQFAVSKVLVLI